MPIHQTAHYAIQPRAPTRSRRRSPSSSTTSPRTSPARAYTPHGSRQTTRRSSSTSSSSKTRPRTRPTASLRLSASSRPPTAPTWPLARSSSPTTPKWRPTSTADICSPARQEHRHDQPDRPLPGLMPERLYNAFLSAEDHAAMTADGHQHVIYQRPDGTPADGPQAGDRLLAFGQPATARSSTGTRHACSNSSPVSAS